MSQHGVEVINTICALTKLFTYSLGFKDEPDNLGFNDSIDYDFEECIVLNTDMTCFDDKNCFGNLNSICEYSKF